MSAGRFAVARAYNAQRGAVTAEYAKSGHSAKHKIELSKLATLADMLHLAEEADRVPRGSTRETLHAYGLARLTGEDQSGEGCKVCV